MPRRKNNSDDAAMGCIVYMILGLVFLPLVGLYFICDKNPDRKALGWVLLIVGIILWIVIAAGSA